MLEDAELLLARRRWARAGALAILAVEESRKAHHGRVWAFHVLPTLDDRSDAAAWGGFWDGFTDHPAKLDL